jgi:hypothetical protein
MSSPGRRRGNEDRLALIRLVGSCHHRRNARHQISKASSIKGGQVVMDGLEQVNDWLGSFAIFIGFESSEIFPGKSSGSEGTHELFISGQPFGRLPVLTRPLTRR